MQTVHYNFIFEADVWILCENSAQAEKALNENILCVVLGLYYRCIYGILSNRQINE